MILIDSPSLLLPGALVPVVGLALSLLSPIHADERQLIEDAHHQLAQALNLGGDPPSDADRTKELQAALDDLKLLPPRYHGHRVVAMSFIKTALAELAQRRPESPSCHRYP